MTLFLTSNPYHLISKGYEKPYLNPSVCAVYSATCNSGLVGVYSPGLAFIVCSVLSFHFELDGAVVIRSWLCLQLMQSERNITFFVVTFEIKITQPFYDIFDSYRPIIIFHGRHWRVAGGNFTRLKGAAGQWQRAALLLVPPPSSFR